jgi:hypothetical protein
VDETGGQIAVFGRRGTRALTGEESQRLYLDETGKPWFVNDAAAPAAPAAKTAQASKPGH